MTVIAWDGRMLAADRLASYNGHKRSATKIFRLDSQRLVAFAGTAPIAHAVLAWLRDSERKIEAFPKSADTHAFVVHRDGHAECYEGEAHPVPVLEPFFASGAGRDYALAAMHLGYDARRAVEVACALDIYCGNGIDTLTFEED